MTTGVGKPRTSWMGEIAFTAVALIAIAAVFAFRWAQDRSPQANAFPLGDSGLTISPDRLHFGDVWENSQFILPLPIHNPLDHDVDIQDLSTSCTCSEIEPRSLNIPAGESREVRLTLDLTAARSKVADAEWRDFQVNLSPRIAGVRKEGWTVHGSVHTAVRLEQPLLDVGRHSEAAQPLSALKANVTSYLPLEALIAEPRSPLLAVNVKRSSDNPRRFEVLISPTKLPVGPVDAKIALIAQVEGGVRTPPKFMAISGRIVSDFQASPPEAVFGGQPVGDIAEETLTVYSLTNEPFEIVGLKTEGEGLAVEKASLQDVDGRTFFLKQRIAKLGQQQGRVSFRLRDRAQKQRQLEVAVSYLGIGPHAN